MKPSNSKSQDENRLEVLGRASLQIVHDLKNQLNGFKLYATFLRKRLEKAEHPSDELETIKKLISGIDRAAEDLSLISDYGKQPALRKHSPVELRKILDAAVTTLETNGSAETNIVINATSEQLLAELDSQAVTEALRSISNGVARIHKSKKKEGPLTIQVSSEKKGASHDAIIDWHTSDAFDHDPFRSFAGPAEIRMALAAQVIEAHGGSAEKTNDALRVRLPLIN